VTEACADTESETVAVTLFVPASCPTVQPGTTTVPSELVVAVVEFREPPPPVMVNSTVALATGAPPAFVTLKTTGSGVALPIRTVCPSPETSWISAGELRSGPVGDAVLESPPHELISQQVKVSMITVRSRDRKNLILV